MLFCLGCAQSQETETYVLQQAVSNRETIVYTRVIRFDGRKHLYHVRDYYENGQFQLEAFYSSFDKRVKEGYQCNYRSNTKEGPYTEWHRNGRIEFTGHFNRCLLNGASTANYESGQKEAEENSLDGQLHGRVRYWSENFYKEVTARYRIDTDRIYLPPTTRCNPRLPGASTLCWGVRPGQRLRVGVDARALAERPCGFRRYLEGLLPALGRVDASLETVLFTTTTAPEAGGLPAGLPVVRSPGSLFTLLRPWWEITSLPRALAGADVDVFFSLWGALPLTLPTPAVVMIHDLALLRVPGTQPWYCSWYWRTVYRRCRRADRAVVPSRATQRDVIELLGVDPTRVTVVPEAADQHFRPAPPAAVARVLAARGIHGEYVLAVGTREPRKNLATLVAAMERVNRERSGPVELVVAGSRGWGSEAFLRGRPDWLRVLGPVPDDDLVALYSGATAFAFPSLYEGFGLPMLEAMRCGAPVVASETSAIPEVAGDAAILVAPTDTAGWARALGALLHDPMRRRELSQRARYRAESFSWDATARGVAAALRDAVGDRRARAARARIAGGVPAPHGSLRAR